MKRGWMWVFAPLLLGGCASQQSGGVLKNTARGFLLGRAYDRSVAALRREDDAGFEAATRDAAKVALPNSEAGRTVATSLLALAIDADARAQTLPNGSAAKAAAQRRSDGLYRSAQRAAGRFDSPNPQALNALGYFLADRGTSAHDFKEAERLTRRSVALYDEILAPTVDGRVNAALSGLGSEKLHGSRAITRDSLAWALFKQGRFGEAAQQQRRALQELRAHTPDAASEKELVSHLAQIEAALGKTQSKPAPRKPSTARARHFSL